MLAKWIMHLFELVFKQRVKRVIFGLSQHDLFIKWLSWKGRVRSTYLSNLSCRVIRYLNVLC
jgi:hypothetical protein